MAGLIPDFADGVLPEGLHRCTVADFIDRFCHGSDAREDALISVLEALDYAKTNNARFVFVGGSFVTADSTPNDIDLVFVFKRRDAIPVSPERRLRGNQTLDIMLCSADEPRVVDAYVHLLSEHRNGRTVGVIQIELYRSNDRWEPRQEADAELLNMIREGYIRRAFVSLSEPPGVLITVHGLLSHAEWNAEITRAASRQGWVVAPFSYGFTTPTALLSGKQRSAVLEAFRLWLFDLASEGPYPVSAIAHSFGTYLIAAYLSGFDVPPVWFNSVIFTGSIVRTDFDWSVHVGKGVSYVYNEIAPKDQWVSWMPEGWIGQDPLFGRSGVSGFSSKNDVLTQGRATAFDHNNALRRDVIAGRWLPLLNAKKQAYVTTRRGLTLRQQPAVSTPDW